ncbi:TIGR04282 family arsenosugar biosynthesis glycosyltransferase [Azospirillum canadense]|uniref:TIGR04282 family arsenosugar biosynthesis glycosyltransferase n=1 Tax=Azospirillum canadense TaxID=403962 RepID=UPI002225C888|nr:TIGR04282 family arsenosugar biosynthesis glycosyltransferase [Azospirillum canadense]MCW2236969.1 rSAM/selenodomain-associated transferase 1 [Azospirillum canadense]
MRQRKHLIVFARPPRLGRGKRRLAKDVGTVAAWRFYRTVLSALLWRLHRDSRWILWLAVTPDRSAGERGWPVRTLRIGQGGGDLGQRMARALRERPCGPAVLIGSDIPEIQPADIAAAFRGLGRNDVVFGPARDGGYWLVGVRRTRALPRTLFDGVRWSTPHALADTVAGLQPGTKVGLVATMEDVDDLDSYQRVWMDGGQGRRRRKR